MKYLKIIVIVVIVIIILVCSQNIVLSFESGAKLKDILNLNEKLEVIIDEVYYEKARVFEMDIGKEIRIDIQRLKDMFLNDAVVVNSVEINYMFDHEPIVIFGYLKINDKEIYYFDYNLGGFGTIYKNRKEYILYGDATKMINPELY